MSAAHTGSCAAPRYTPHAGGGGGWGWGCQERHTRQVEDSKASAGLGTRHLCWHLCSGRRHVLSAVTLTPWAASPSDATSSQAREGSREGFAFNDVAHNSRRSFHASVRAMRCAAAHHGRALRVRATLGGSDDGAAQDGSARRRMELPKHGVSGALGLARGGVGLAFSVARGVMRAPDQLSKAAGVPDNPVNLTFNGTGRPPCRPLLAPTRRRVCGWTRAVPRGAGLSRRRRSARALCFIRRDIFLRDRHKRHRRGWRNPTSNRT